MVLPDYPPPMRDGNDSSSTRTSLYKSRHISLQSRVDSLAADSMWDESRESVPEIPAIYSSGRGRSTSFLMDPSMMRSSNPESMKDDAESTGYIVSPSPDPPSTPAPPSDSPLNISVFHETLFIGVVIMAQFMGLAGLGQSIAPMHIIAEGLHVTNPGEQAWFAAAFSLTVGTFILISGRMGDILGHKRVFVFGYFFLGCWSAFAGFSAYVERQIFFDICRAFQGIGAALLAPNALALLGRAYPPGIKKNIVFSLFGAMAPWGFVMGALFSSVFAQLAWWPWAFWSYGIAAWALSAFSVIIIPKALAHDAQFAGRSNRPGMDWTGSILGVIGLILINVAWNNGPLFGWGQPHVYFVLIIGIFSLIAFVWVEARAVSPILPVRAMSSTVTYTMALVGIGWGSFGIWIYYSWRFLEEIRGHSPLSVSAQYTPALVCGLLAAGATGFMLTHTPVAFTMMIAMVAFFLGELITATQPAHQTYWAQMFVAILIMPFGMDMSFPAGTVILSNHMPREHQGLAASLVNTMVNYSISIALGIAGTVEVQVNNHGKTEADVIHGIRCAWYTGVALAGCGVILGAMFFGRTLLREGWKIMDH
ncbi:hypothetical protein PRZ48_003658 [Zasmidium cellare]|uniref:Major facilitator superfamily (MFS) profile domain-containing protein n=1 Tax=Zasmidium cellare TaxID=395010 RepID=A0ABR0EX91_ZASCE|nr:hypothetical protein PRZ48_003658 [Zasmidium cellare]